MLPVINFEHESAKIFADAIQKVQASVDGCLRLANMPGAPEGQRAEWRRLADEGLETIDQMLDDWAA